MIKLSNKISKSITDKTGAISEDENVRFRKHLMTLGVTDEKGNDNNSSSSGSQFEDENEDLFNALEAKGEESGGFLLLSDVFCIVNRVKGIDLISPEDTLKFVDTITGRYSSKCKLIRYESGAMALEFFSDQNHSLESYFSCAEYVDDFPFLTAEMLNANFNIPILVANERLKMGLKSGHLCSDFSMQGQRYFKNLFV